MQMDQTERPTPLRRCWLPSYDGYTSLPWESPGPGQSLRAQRSPDGRRKLILSSFGVQDMTIPMTSEFLYPTRGSDYS